MVNAVGARLVTSSRISSWTLLPFTPLDDFGSALVGRGALNPDIDVNRLEGWLSGASSAGVVSSLTYSHVLGKV